MDVPSSRLPLAVSALAVVAGMVLTLASHPLGPLSAHMAVHIALMNVAAPLMAALLVNASNGTAASLWSMAAVQMTVLWAWHAPPLQQHLLASAVLNAAAHGALFLIAFAFWRALLRVAPDRRWHAIPVLALTGKLFCLLGVLLIFAPRPLFAVHAAGHDGAHGALADRAAADLIAAALADQQLAGLMMITACPLSYLVAATMLAARLIRSQGASPLTARDRQ